jgi:hypothetical protein
MLKKLKLRGSQDQGHGLFISHQVISAGCL